MFIAYSLTFGIFIASYFATQKIMNNLKEIDTEQLKQVEM